MTNSECHSINPGDTVERWERGQAYSRYTVKTVAHVGICDNKRSKSDGHAFAYVRCEFGPTSEIGFSVESDDYVNGQGYPTHDRNGKRLGGYVLIRGN